MKNANVSKGSRGIKWAMTSLAEAAEKGEDIGDISDDSGLPWMRNRKY